MGRVSLLDRFRFTGSTVRAMALDRAIHAFAAVRFAMPDARPSRFGAAVVRDVPYVDDGHLDHTLDVYIPTRAAKPLPIVLYVHGGGFSMLSKDTHRGMALAYARRGYLVFIINYRLGPKNVFPVPFEDACAALAWVHAHGARYGGDTTRIAVAGESAGGNLVTALTVATCIRRPEPCARALFDAGVTLRATVATYGFLDLEAVEHYLAHPRLHPFAKDAALHAAASYVGLDVRAGCAAAPLASPLTILERATRTDRPLPPFFADAGTRDPLLGDSKRLKAAVERLGSSCTLHVAPGEIHGYDALMWRPAAREKWARVGAWLAPHMAPVSRSADSRSASAAE